MSPVTLLNCGGEGARCRVRCQADASRIAGDTGYREKGEHEELHLPATVVVVVVLVEVLVDVLVEVLVEVLVDVEVDVEVGVEVLGVLVVVVGVVVDRVTVGVDVVLVGTHAKVVLSKRAKRANDDTMSITSLSAPQHRKQRISENPGLKLHNMIVDTSIPETTQRGISLFQLGLVNLHELYPATRSSTQCFGVANGFQKNGDNQGLTKNG